MRRICRGSCTSTAAVKPNLDRATFRARRGYVGVPFTSGGTGVTGSHRTEFTKWGRYEGEMAKVRWRTLMRPNARHNPWFHGL